MGLAEQLDLASERTAEPVATINGFVPHPAIYRLRIGGMPSHALCRPHSIAFATNAYSGGRWLRSPWVILQTRSVPQDRDDQSDQG
jgi:hypothetical protein